MYDTWVEPKTNPSWNLKMNLNMKAEHMVCHLT